MYYLKISTKSNCPIVSCRISVALLVFCLEDLSIDVSEVLRSSIVIIFPSVSPFGSVSICFMHLGTPILGTYMLMSVIFSSCINLFIVLCPLSFLIAFV